MVLMNSKIAIISYMLSSNNGQKCVSYLAQFENQSRLKKSNPILVEIKY